MPALAARRAPAARRGRLAAAAAARPGPASAASSAEPAKPERAGGPLQWLSGAVQALLKVRPPPSALSPSSSPRSPPPPPAPGPPRPPTKRRGASRARQRGADGAPFIVGPQIPHDEVEFPIVPLDNDVENWGKAHERKRFNHLDGACWRHLA